MKKLLISLVLSGTIAFGASCSAAPTFTPTPTDPPQTLTPAATVTSVPSWKVLKTVHFDNPFLYGGFLDGSFGLVLGSIGSGHNGALYYTGDQGATWQRGESSSPFLFGLDIVDSQTAWSCGESGSIRKTLDGGKTWQSVVNFGDPEPNQCRFLSFLDGMVGWAATATRLGFTMDGGETWQEKTLPTDIVSIAAISLKTASEGYLLAANGALFTTLDGGNTWTSSPLEFAQGAFLGKMPAPVAAMRFLVTGQAMIVLMRASGGNGLQLWSAYTNDRGQTWQMDLLPFDPGIQNVFLSRDARTLTVINTGLQQMSILQFQPQ